MRILITNDDGISAPGLVVAEEIAREIAGPDGEVWVVAPAFEQSGVGHCVSYIRPMRIEPLGERRFAVEGSPADCVLAAVCDILAETPPDLVLSGVNRGHNVAEDTLYSGTIGGAMEGALHGFRSIALSQYFGAPRPDMDLFGAAREHGAKVIRRLVDGAGWSKAGYHVFYNVNFPAVPPGEVLGVRATVQGSRPGPTFGTQPQTSPNGRRYLWLKHGHGNAGAAPGSDARECYEGYVTVTPLSADLTVRDQIAPLAEALG
ncbi:5'/3'-nucleotidase SurE [Amaricoccus solimangrovi]|uniref:5'-nucleotidase SurE n=1 Tax=Amaricoccus solimangrovi TaxID=2589815 RepID=A0A501WVX5_9RHOB|nr:5'/3'-nucleotidase SurE [Amaricoccus solimangrovi]TPE53903.1 5'/3'-nucleotidase SurE [Amaricoccus solimangrovi]